STAAATAARPATPAGRTCADAHATSAAAAPTPAPTSGKWTVPRPTSAGPIPAPRPTGTTVRNATAALRPASTAGRPSGAGIRDAGVLERRHVAQQHEGGLDHRQRQGGPAALAQPQPEVEQRRQAELGEDGGV